MSGFKPPDISDLEKLAQKLVTTGPYKAVPTPRRIRALLNGVYVFDTINAYHVWEHSYYPQLYIPAKDFSPEATLQTSSQPISGTNDGAYMATLTVGNKSTPRVIVFLKEPLDGLVKVDFPALDHWFEEGVPIYQHPKDPYKRIEVLRSTRNIKVVLDGVTLAESSDPLVLFETSLPTRYYLNPTTVNWTVLTQSGLETYCPYKGRANYYNVEVNGKVYENYVWYYQYPTLESILVQGALCFYNEKVEVYVDGVKEETPKSHFG